MYGYALPKGIEKDKLSQGISKKGVAAENVKEDEEPVTLEPMASGA